MGKNATMHKMYEKQNGKIVEKIQEDSTRIFKSKRAMKKSDIFKDEQEKFQEVTSAVVDEFGGITLITKEFKG